MKMAKEGWWMSNTVKPSPAPPPRITKPKGRPLGSKNKPKPPHSAAQDSLNGIQSHVIEIPNGADIYQSLLQFATRRQRGVSVMSASGVVANVCLRQPMAHGGVMVLEGRFGIVSLNGSFVGGAVPTALSVYVSGGDGGVFGGRVVGPLVASGKVMVMVAAFANAVYEILPIHDDDDDHHHHHHHHLLPDMNVEPCSSNST